MATPARSNSGKGTFAHGIHPPEQKSFSVDKAIEVFPAPDQVMIPLLQNAGAPSKPAVKAKQEVAIGDLVAEATGFVSANSHSPINGVVKKQGVTTLPNGRHVGAIPITANGDQLDGQALWDDLFGDDWDSVDIGQYEPDAIFAAVKDAGIVGLGGAAFPTHVKLARNDEKPIDTLMVNGCECEPYLTCDYRMMLETPNPILVGAQLMARAIGAKRIIVGIEANKPDAVNVLKPLAEKRGVEIAVLQTKYPQGAEKNLIQAALGREVPLGGLPMDVGVAVTNVGSAASIARAVVHGKPLTHRVISVTGGGIKNPKNLLVPIGVRIGDIVEYCGGLTPDAARMISGGPMMGFAFSNMDAVITKGSSGITVLTQDDIAAVTETNCVRCGQCVKACPMNLVPAKLALAARNDDSELAQKYHIMACFECGCCTYTCPARISLMQLIRMQKARIVAASRK